VRRLHRTTLVGAFVLALAANAAAQGPASCTTAQQNLYVREVMSDIYFWYREIPNLDPAKFDSPEAYLDAIRYKAIDHTFSYITSRASNDAFFSDSQFIGFGFSMAFNAAGELRVSDVFPDSPASEANLSRGDRIVEINAQTVAALLESGGLADVFGPSEIGIEGNLVILHGGTSYQAHMTKRLVTIPTVSLTKVYETDGRRVGYVSFKNFVEPSFDALDVAFAELRRLEVNELVLDLRYNGGGLVSVAQRLASLIGGTHTAGQVFAEYFHNDRNAFRNKTLRFEQPSNALGLERLVVITTRASASASELVINSLRPFLPVFVVGDWTYGKPVGQYAIPFCDKVLAPVSFTVRNANGEGDYFDGIAPTCAAPDDLDSPLGDVREGSLREALGLIATGHCSTTSTTAGRTLSRITTRQPVLTGWQSLVGAH
jgi:C-terminal processing protease CtpA/Prc